MITIHKRLITDEDMADIATYMDDDIREKLHLEMAPCTYDEFLLAYLEEAPDRDAFMDIMQREFDMVFDARYSVFWVGGERDGEILYETDDLDDAIKAGNRIYKEHETDFDTVCGGVGICDNENPDELIEW